PDRVPIDLGGSAVTGMHVSTVYALRQALELDSPGTRVKVIEPFQMLGEVAPDLQAVLGVDVVGLIGDKTMFGYEIGDWKPWTLFDGTPVMVPGRFNTEPREDGSISMYPKGVKSVAPCAKMPEGGFYFDATERQKPIDWKKLDPLDNMEEFNAISNEDLRYYREESKRLYATGKAILANFGGTSFGDIALIPGLDLLDPRGVRGVKEWYMCHVRRPDFIEQVFKLQLQIALENLEKIHNAVGDRVTAVFITGTDFGAQRKPILSNASYRKLYKPYHVEVNNWVHENTGWRTFIHSCGSVEPLIGEFIEAGFDILNPVQTSAANMEPRELKTKYGDQITFWGGGVDTQHTLPFGSPEDVERQVKERLDILGENGGFVFNTIHNVQPNVPVENVQAMYRAITNIDD
ncbi:MAG: methyltransferase, partial [Candidatus Bathyarchaeota archaeon]|nr:methyltransferase [Candidatus Bathyarchaeota archaeon]